MVKKRVAVKTLIVYLILVTMSTAAVKMIEQSIENKFLFTSLEIGLQLVCTMYLVYVAKKSYGWKNAGFTKINAKGFIWFVPHTIIISCMMYTLGQGIYENIELINMQVIAVIILNFIGCIIAGASEELIFRGMVLNSFKTQKSIVPAMVISSLGFGIVHIGTVFFGMPLIDALAGALSSSLLGFALVPLTIKLNNIVPAMMFHVLWNTVLLTSGMLRIEISQVAYLTNPVNIIIGIVLGIVVIKEHKKQKNVPKYKLSDKLLNSVAR